MKTNIVPLAAFLAALATIALVPVSAATACAALTVTGLLSTIAADYGRARRPVLVLAPVLPYTPPAEVAAAEAA
jgi:hypothetical protein